MIDEAVQAKNRFKSKVRAKVEHSIGVIKRVFGFAKLRYRGLDKNAHRLFVTCALANLFIARRSSHSRSRAAADGEHLTSPHRVIQAKC